MGIGASIFLIAVGAVLALAVDVQVGGLDLSVIGWILVAVGVLGLVVTLVIWAPRRGRSAATTSDVVEERRVYDRRTPPPPEM